IFSVLLSMVLVFFMFSCDIISPGVVFRNLTPEQKTLLDEIESYSMTAEQGYELYIWGGIGFYTRDSENHIIYLNNYDVSDVAGYIDCQDNYSYFYSHRFESYVGKIIEGRESQLLMTDFVDDDLTTVESISSNTRSHFEDSVMFYGYTFANYGAYSTNDDETATVVTTSIEEILEKDSTFLNDTLRLTENEISDNLHQEVVITYDFSQDNMFEFTCSIKEFYEKEKTDKPIKFEYELTYMIKEIVYDRNSENLPPFSFPTDYHDCDVAFQAGNPIKMRLNPNDDTYIKLYLHADIYSIHLAGKDLIYSSIKLYNTEMALMTKEEDHYNIEEEGIYYLKMETSNVRISTGYLYIDKGIDDSYRYMYGGIISEIYANENREYSLIQHVPEDGYISFSGVGAFTFEIVHNHISYYNVAYEPLYIPVNEGDLVTVTIISFMEIGRGSINWDFVLEASD
ncbi:MAG TPA: hypothetical protein PK113_03780, partial [Bacillota bacterium]|nr:hypothetical protein [Bacillota bacterium]